MPNWIVYGSSHACMLIEQTRTTHLLDCSSDSEMVRALAFWLLVLADTLSLLVATLSLWPGHQRRGSR